MNQYSDTNYRGRTNQRGTDWIDRRELAHIWRQLRGIKSQNEATLTITNGPDGPTFLARGAAFPVTARLNRGRDKITVTLDSSAGGVSSWMRFANSPNDPAFAISGLPDGRHEIFCSLHLFEYTEATATWRFGGDSEYCSTFAPRNNSGHLGGSANQSPETFFYMTIGRVAAVVADGAITSWTFDRPRLADAIFWFNNLAANTPFWWRFNEAEQAHEIQLRWPRFMDTAGRRVTGPSADTGFWYQLPNTHRRIGYRYDATGALVFTGGASADYNYTLGTARIFYDRIIEKWLLGGWAWDTSSKLIHSNGYTGSMQVLDSDGITVRTLTFLNGIMIGGSGSSGASGSSSSQSASDVTSETSSDGYSVPF